jgi:hypothetical protein
MLSLVPNGMTRAVPEALQTDNLLPRSLRDIMKTQLQTSRKYGGKHRDEKPLSVVRYKPAFQTPGSGSWFRIREAPIILPKKDSWSFF